MNSLKSIVVAVFAGATFAVSLPAMAQNRAGGDSANIYNNTQTTDNRGSGNTLRNNSTQSGTSIRNGNAAGDDGNVVNNDQYIKNRGNNNEVTNNSKQEFTQIRNTGRVQIRR